MTLEERAEEYLSDNFDPTRETVENDVKQAYIAGARGVAQQFAELFGICISHKEADRFIERLEKN